MKVLHKVDDVRPIVRDFFRLKKYKNFDNIN